MTEGGISFLYMIFKPFKFLRLNDRCHESLILRHCNVLRDQLVLKMLDIFMIRHLLGKKYRL